MSRGKINSISEDTGKRPGGFSKVKGLLVMAEAVAGTSAKGARRPGSGGRMDTEETNGWREQTLPAGKTLFEGHRWKRIFIYTLDSSMTNGIVGNTVSLAS